jgi:hypothetical protein
MHELFQPLALIRLLKHDLPQGSPIQNSVSRIMSLGMHDISITLQYRRCTSAPRSQCLSGEHIRIEHG